MVETINLEPHWPGILKFFLHMEETDPEQFRKMITDIGDEDWERIKDLGSVAPRRELRKVNRMALTKLPWMCAHRSAVDGKTIVIIRGEDGYIPADDMISDPDKFNMRMGVDAYQAEAMSAGSMFGWHVEGCDPDGYKEKLEPVTGSYTELQKRAG